MQSSLWGAFVDEHRVKLITAAARDIHLAETETYSPVDAILVGVDAQLGFSPELCINDTPIETACFNIDIHARGSTDIDEEADGNQDRLLTIRQIGIEEVAFIRIFRPQQLILCSCFQCEMRVEIEQRHETGIDAITVLAIETRIGEGDVTVDQRHRRHDFKRLSLAAMDGGYFPR